MLKKIVLTACAFAFAAAPLLAQETSPPPDGPQLVLMPPPGTEKPEDVGEPPADPEAAKDWLTGVFHSMMDIDSSGALSQAELRAWVAHVQFMPMGSGDFDGELEPAFPVTCLQRAFVSRIDQIPKTRAAFSPRTRERLSSSRSPAKVRTSSRAWR